MVIVFFSSSFFLFLFLVCTSLSVTKRFHRVQENTSFCGFLTNGKQDNAYPLRSSSSSHFLLTSKCTFQREQHPFPQFKTVTSVFWKSFIKLEYGRRGDVTQNYCVWLTNIVSCTLDTIGVFVVGAKDGVIFTGLNSRKILWQFCPWEKTQKPQCK